MNRSSCTVLGRWLLLTAVALWAPGCVSPKDRVSSSTVIRKLSFPRDGQSQAFAARATAIAERSYPQVCGLLREADLEFPSRFGIGMKKSLRSGNVAETRMNEIWLNGDYAQKFHDDPAYFEDVLVHEMAHVAQEYYRPLIGKWLVYDMEPPKAWVEGIADYSTFKLGFTNSWHCPECTSAFPHYRDGYACAGAFLLFVEQKYEPRFVPRLNALLRQGGYTDAVFEHWTGRDLPSLWSEFQKTPAFTESAASMLTFQQELGFQDGKPPKDIRKRIENLVAASQDPHLARLLKGVQLPGLNRKEVGTHLALLHYFTQPGGTAEGFMLDLLEKHRLPGFLKGDHGTLDSALTHKELNQRYPVSRSFSARKRGSDSIYHYTVLRASPTDPWRLHRAWRARPDGMVAEEYAPPAE